MTSVSRLCACLLLFAASEAGAIVIDFRADLDAMQARAGAGTQSSGTGTATVHFDTDTNVLTWQIVYQDLTEATVSRAGHFHGPALPGAGAAPRVFVDPGPSPIVGQMDLDDPMSRVDGETARQELLDGLWYLNLHTTANPSGEIRGQVLPVSAQSPLVAGDIVALDQNTAQVVKIDPATGEEKVLSARVAMDSLVDVTVTPDGGAFAIDRGDRGCQAATRSLTRIDTRTGKSEVALPDVAAMRVASDGLGRIYLLSDFVTRFDPQSGAVDDLSYLGNGNVDIAVSAAAEIYVIRLVSVQTGAHQIVRVDATDGSLEPLAFVGGPAQLDLSPLALDVSSTGSLIVLTVDGGVGGLLSVDLLTPPPIVPQPLTSGGFLTGNVEDLAIDAFGEITVMQDRLADLVQVNAAGVQSLTAFDPLDGPFLDASQLGSLEGGVAIAPDGRVVRALANCQLGTTGLVSSSFDDGSQGFVTSRGLLNTAGLRRLAVSADGRDVFVSALIDDPEVEIHRIDPGLGQQQPVLVRDDEGNAGSTIFSVDSDGRLLFPNCAGASSCTLLAFDPADPTAPLAVVASGSPLDGDSPLDLVVAEDGLVYHLGTSSIPIRVDPETGQQSGGTPTGDSNPLGGAHRIAVTADGQVYVANDALVARTGLAGFSTVVGIGGLLHDLQAIAAGPSGELYALTPTDVVQIDPARNPAVNQTLIASLPDRSLLDFAVVVPTPSPWMACVAAFTTLALMRAHRGLRRSASRPRPTR